MNLLLDTNALIWFLEDAPQMTDDLKNLVEDKDTRCHMSLVSAWEIAIKVSIGKLQVSYAIEPGLRRLVEKMGFVPLSPSWEEFGMVERLPFHHGDPFDRLLICQAQRHGLTVLSPDMAFDAYGVPRHWSGSRAPRVVR